jgi:hypothetical protein
MPEATPLTPEQATTLFLDQHTDLTALIRLREEGDQMRREMVALFQRHIDAARASADWLQREAIEEEIDRLNAERPPISPDASLEERLNQTAEDICILLARQLGPTPTLRGLTGCFQLPAIQEQLADLTTDQRRVVCQAIAERLWYTASEPWVKHLEAQGMTDRTYGAPGGHLDQAVDAFYALLRLDPA